ncbi:hypothetical protein LCGC14_0481580 [marine sediment metagenome]|uniref:DUF3854 domain-containing protein n=1 Tax=marine sediment metagenome TaxID=412755 RepID=A0A0F9VHZ5_9ZZZZ
MTADARIGLSQGAIEDLQKSGIGPRDIAARILTGAEVAATSAGGSSYIPDGYVIPYFDFQGEIAPYYRVKILDPLGGPKYRALAGYPNHIYFPPDLRKVLKSSQADYIIITEGEKKAVCAVKCGFPCVALSGIDCWRNKQITFPKDTKLKAVKVGAGSVMKAIIPSGDSNATVLQDSGIVAVGLHDLLDHMVANSMEAIIIFDSNKGGVKSQVQRAAAQLGYELRYRGLPIINIRQLILPTTAKDPKMGLDDYLVTQGVKSFAGILRTCRRKRIAFPRHPNPKAFIAGRLQKARLSRKETQDVSLSILMELETRGRRLRNTNTHDMFFFNDKTHMLMDVALGNPRIMLHDTAFGSYLYQEFNLAAIDQRIVGWLAAQFHGEPGIKEAVTHRVLAQPANMPGCIAYQLSDSHFIIMTPDPSKPYIICENGMHGVLFEQGHVEPISHVNIVASLEMKLDDSAVLWHEVLKSFNFLPSAVPTEGIPQEQLLTEGRLLATLLYYLSPWFLRWRGTQLPIELIIGEPGCGKSSLYALRQSVITGYPRLTNMTNDIKDWYAGITSSGGLYVLDNIHFTAANKDYQQRLSDEMCRLVTEPSPHIELRKLYTTSDILRLPVNSTFALTALEQPFITPDLIQRSAIFELQVIQSGHDAMWVEKQIARGPGREGWIAHQLIVIHRFLRRALHDKEWDNNFRAGHRLANYEQALIMMAKVLDLPFDWIPEALARQMALKLSETDWVMAGIADFIEAFRSKHGEEYTAKRFAISEIVDWAEQDETYCKNRKLTNSWSLGKYVRGHKGTLEKNLFMHQDGTKNNKAMYRIN